MTVSGRLGQFFFIVGLVLLIIFFATQRSGDPQYGLFLPGLAGFALGVLLIWRGRSPGEPSDRFRSWREAQSKKANRKNKGKR
jgi:hypothetical protein